MKKLRSAIVREAHDYRVLLRNVPSATMALFVASCILMNLLANREISLNLSWLALDCGFTVSWMSFLCMDMLTKRFGSRAAIKLSIFAVGVNLLCSALMFIIMKIPGCWGQYYEFGMIEVNQALDATLSGTWYIVAGSAIAFIVSAVVNAVINSAIGKMFKKTSFLEYAVRSYVSTAIGQFVDNMVFATLISAVFFGWSWLQCITCSLTGALVELLCEVIFSPFGYRVSKAWERDDVGKAYLDHINQRG